jgi:hypothetical protein
MSDRACTGVTPPNFHGKEGVDGSNPSEGLRNVPANQHFVVVYLTNERTHSGHIFGTRDALRRLASLSDTSMTRVGRDFRDRGSDTRHAKRRASLLSLMRSKARLGSRPTTDEKAARDECSGDDEGAG